MTLLRTLLMAAKIKLFEIKSRTVFIPLSLKEDLTYLQVIETENFIGQLQNGFLPFWKVLY